MSGIVDSAARGWADPQWASDNVHRTNPHNEEEEMTDTFMSLARHKASKVAEAIYDHIDYYGIAELDTVRDLLAGEISIEQFIRDTEARMAEVAALRKEGNY